MLTNGSERVALDVRGLQYCVKRQLLRSRLNCVASGVLKLPISYKTGFGEVKHSNQYFLE